MGTVCAFCWFCCEPKTARQIRSIFKNRRGKRSGKWVSPQATGSLQQSLSALAMPARLPPSLPRRALPHEPQAGRGASLSVCVPICS